MKLSTKLLLAFLIFALIGVSTLALTSVANHRTVSRLMNDLKESNLDDVKTTNYIADLIKTVDDLNLVQRTLLIPGLTQAERDVSYAAEDELRRKLDQSLTDIEAHWRGSASNITAFAKGRWPEVTKLLTAYLDSIKELEEINRAIDATFIHDPKQLMRLQQEYRGNHFSVASRAGEVYANQKAVGAPLTFDESKCTLQKWRLGVINRELPYYKNSVIVKAVEDLDAPHRLMHRIAEETYDRYAAGTADPVRILAEINQMMPAVRRMNDHFQAVIAEAEKSQALFDQAFELAITKSIAAGDSLAAALRSINQEAIDMSGQKAVRAVEAGEKSISVATWLTFGCIALNVLLFLLVQFFVSRRVVSPLARTIGNLTLDSEAVGRDADQIKGASVQLNESSLSQGDSVDKTTHSLEQVTSITHANVENADGANHLMGQAADQVARGEEAVGKMLAAMEVISESSEQIESILKTIESISFQTSLLALNASVEAARAGEAGQGFAVVAEEVKNLAQRSAESARSTAQLVGRSVESVRNGGVIAKELEDEFVGIKKTTDDIEAMIRSIAEASREQATGIDQVNEAMREIDESSRRNRQNAGRMSDSGSSIAEVADNLRSRVAELREILGGR